MEMSLSKGHRQDFFDSLRRNGGELAAHFLRNAIFAMIADRGPDRS